MSHVALINGITIRYSIIVLLIVIFYSTNAKLGHNAHEHALDREEKEIAAMLEGLMVSELASLLVVWTNVHSPLINNPA